MAAEKEYKPSDEQEEPKIPVFTVLKNGAILKNIFIVNNTCSSSRLNPIMGNNQDHQQQEEILIIGRHPDCNVMLTHPSISRFHLKIISNPSLQKLSVIDLSSGESRVKAQFLRRSKFRCLFRKFRGFKGFFFLILCSAWDVGFREEDRPVGASGASGGRLVEDRRLEQSLSASLDSFGQSFRFRDPIRFGIG